MLSPAQRENSAAGRCALAIMAKAPRAGEVKTRLTPPLSAEEAALLNVCFLRDISASVSQAGSGTLGIACYTPRGAEESFKTFLPPTFYLLPQRGDALTERLICATEDLLKVGFASVCLINSDSPTVPAVTFAEAARLLAHPGDCIVLGPADDGGYYLIGLKQTHRRIFENIEWSTSRVLAQTMERAAELQLRVHLLPAAYDVDDAATLRRLSHELLSPNDSTAVPCARATASYLRELVAREGRERICGD
ncbi:MAG TPA: TIGR04282 family arsenosugar biosynthesis glycosyltransferase [Chthoniobacterales bacterium]|nr:TIGR04282 family arsenosugar biosynthesis glycosyltransferase [Chthoniobacterales bacterium]